MQIFETRDANEDEDGGVEGGSIGIGHGRVCWEVQLVSIDASSP